MKRASLTCDNEMPFDTSYSLSKAELMAMAFRRFSANEGLVC